jgi:hypothetical protein
MKLPPFRAKPSTPLNRAASGQKVNDQDYECHDQQQMYETAADSTNRTEQPEN